MTIESRSSQNMPVEIGGYNGEKVSFSEIADVLASSRYGKVLKGQPRFDYYRPNTTTPEQWIDLLGPDVDNLAHMPYTFNLANDFLAGNDDFNVDEKTALLFCAMTHDMQEAITGDKRKIDKTDEDEKMEAELLSSILSEVLASELDCVRLGELTRSVAEIITNEQSRLGRAFSAIEKLGYAKTALKAWEIKKQEDIDDYGENPLQTGLGALSYSVFVYQTHKMVDHAKDFPYVRNFLVENQTAISEVLEEADELGLYENFRVMKQSMKSWNDFRSLFLV